jgi:hypothetical protein
MSGVKMLEEQADKRWNTLSTYKTYKDNTPVLFPFTKSKASE